MPGFDGTGPMGMGPMTGGGRGFCSPWGMGAAPGTYGFRRWTGYPYYGRGPFFPGAVPFAPPMGREQELDALRAQSEALKQQLSDMQGRIDELEKEEK